MLERKIFLCFFVFLTYFFMFWWIDCYFFIILGIPQPFFFRCPICLFFVMTIPFLRHCDGFARGNLFPYTVIAKRQRRCGNLSTPYPSLREIEDFVAISGMVSCSHKITASAECPPPRDDERKTSQDCRASLAVTSQGTCRHKTAASRCSSQWRGKEKNSSWWRLRRVMTNQNITTFAKLFEKNKKSTWFYIFLCLN